MYPVDLVSRWVHAMFGLMDCQVHAPYSTTLLAHYSELLSSPPSISQITSRHVSAFRSLRFDLASRPPRRHERSRTR